MQSVQLSTGFDTNMVRENNKFGDYKYVKILNCDGEDDNLGMFDGSLKKGTDPVRWEADKVSDVSTLCKT